MNRDEVWQAIDDERISLANLFGSLSADEWETESLCAGWRVRDVAAHLTLAHMGMLPGALAMLRARGNLNRMIRDTAVRRASLPAGQYAVLLRGMIGSRKTAPGITELEPLIDVLVHGQDIAIPLGRTRPMPPAAAATAATRVWSMGRPFHAERKLSGFRLVGTDHPWSAGQGRQVEGPIAAILLLLSGRPATLSQLSGPGAAELRARLSAQPSQAGRPTTGGTTVRAVGQRKRGYRADIAFDGEKAIPGGALVLVEDGVITAVEPGSAPTPEGCEVTYEPGTTVLPGLIDTHSHLCGNSDFGALDRLPGLSPGELDEAIEAAFAAQLAAGVTAVRDLGDQHWAVVDRHRHRLAGPTTVASGPPITSLGGHCAVMGGQASGIGELRRAVRERADRGAGLVKIMTSGGVMTPATDIRACQFTLEEVSAVVDEAHLLGLAVTAHAHALTAVEQCVAAGVDGIEHCSCLSEQGMHTPPRLAAAISAAGILVCPTVGHDLARWDGQPPPQMKAMMERTGFTMEGRRAQVGDLYRGGVTLISGADSGINPVKPHGILPQAVIELADCGVPATTALASATSLAAQACGLARRTGWLRAGLDADLLLVNGDPTTDITAIRNVRTVVSRGRIINTCPGT